MIYEFFPAEVIALNEEVAEHPELMEALHSLGQYDFETMLGGIASYCDLILDGTYSQTDIKVICSTLVQRLKDKRKLVVLPGEASIVVVPHLDDATKEEEEAAKKIVLSGPSSLQ